MRKVAVWKGSLSLGLINIPVELYSVMRSSKTMFTLLHDACKAPIHEVRVCSACQKKIEWAHVVKGIRLGGDAFFVMTKENIKKLRPASSDRIDLVKFVDRDKIDLVYYGQSYYLFPTRLTDKAFFLFSTVLKNVDKVAIGECIIREKQHICMIQSYHNVLLLTLLHYDAEIKKIKTAPITIPPLRADEKKLATDLIAMLTVEDFDSTQFKDLFMQQLKKQVERALKNPKKIAKERVARSSAQPKSNTLMESLQKSISANKRPFLSQKKNKKKKS